MQVINTNLKVKTKYMKKIIQSFLYISIALVFFASCTKDEARDTYVSGTNPILSASVKDSIGLNYLTETDPAITFNWTNPNYQFASGLSSQNVSYSLEMDIAGSNFSSPNKKVISISQDLSVAYTQKAFNILVADLNLATGKLAKIDVRITASIGGTTATKVTSNVLTFKFVPYAPPPKVVIPSGGKLFLVGDATAGGWSNPVPVPSQQFTQISSTVYEITVPLTGGASFLFLPTNGDWGQKYAVVDGSINGLGVGLNFGFYTSGGANMPGPTVSGNYKIHVDFQTGQYTITKI
jgi:hypothetical protein